MAAESQRLDAANTEVTKQIEALKSALPQLAITEDPDTFREQAAVVMSRLRIIHEQSQRAVQLSQVVNTKLQAAARHQRLQQQQAAAQQQQQQQQRDLQQAAARLQLQIRQQEYSKSVARQRHQQHLLLQEQQREAARQAQWQQVHRQRPGIVTGQLADPAASQAALPSTVVGVPVDSHLAVVAPFAQQLPMYPASAAAEWAHRVQQTAAAPETELRQQQAPTAGPTTLSGVPPPAAARPPQQLAGDEAAQKALELRLRAELVRCMPTTREERDAVLARLGLTPEQAKQILRLPASTSAAAAAAGAAAVPQQLEPAPQLEAAVIDLTDEPCSAAAVAGADDALQPCTARLAAAAYDAAVVAVEAEEAMQTLVAEPAAAAQQGCPAADALAHKRDAGELGTPEPPPLEAKRPALAPELQPQAEQQQAAAEGTAGGGHLQELPGSAAAPAGATDEDEDEYIEID